MRVSPLPSPLPFRAFGLARPPHGAPQVLGWSDEDAPVTCTVGYPLGASWVKVFSVLKTPRVSFGHGAWMGPTGIGNAAGEAVRNISYISVHHFDADYGQAV